MEPAQPGARELAMVAGFDDAPFGQHHDAISLLDGREAMGDHGSAPAHELLEGRRRASLSVSAPGRCRVADGRVLRLRAGDALPARKLAPFSPISVARPCGSPRMSSSRALPGRARCRSPNAAASISDVRSDVSLKYQYSGSQESWRRRLEREASGRGHRP
jgi:hypothetical protein